MTWKTVEGDGEMSRSWKFEEDGELIGTFKQTKDAKSKTGKPIKFHEFEREGGEIVSILGGAVLDRTFLGLTPGTKAKIHFLGEKQGKTGTYKNYQVDIWVPDMATPQEAPEEIQIEEGLDPDKIDFGATA